MWPTCAVPRVERLVDSFVGCRIGLGSGGRGVRMSMKFGKRSQKRNIWELLQFGVPFGVPFVHKHTSPPEIELTVLSTFRNCRFCRTARVAAPLAARPKPACLATLESC